MVATAAVTAHALLDVQPAEWSVNALWLALRPDVVLMDIRMPPLDEIEATRRITSAALSFPTGC